MAINPMEREGCWLCAGSGEIETRIAGQNYKDVTVGCPVCVQNDEQWLREKAERERDELAAHVEKARGYLVGHEQLLRKLAAEQPDNDEGDYWERRYRNEADRVNAWYNALPETSLARLKARWQADVLREFTHGSYVMPATVNLAMSERAKELYRQAKGETDESPTD